MTVCLEDEVDISRGDMLVHANNAPHAGRRFEATPAGAVIRLRSSAAATAMQAKVLTKDEARAGSLSTSRSCRGLAYHARRAIF